MISPSASCSTTRRSKQLHFDPGKMAVMVLSDSATHPSNCARLWCSKYPQSTRKIFLGKLKCVAEAFHQISPFPSILPTMCAKLLRFCHLWHPNPLDTTAATLPLLVLSRLPTYESTSARAQVVKKNVVVHACCGHFPLCSTFSKNSTVSPLVSFVTSKGTFWGGSHHNLLPCLPYSISIFSNSSSFSLGSIQFLQLLISKALSSMFCTPSSHCQ